MSWKMPEWMKEIYVALDIEPLIAEDERLKSKRSKYSRGFVDALVMCHRDNLLLTPAKRDALAEQLESQAIAHQEAMDSANRTINGYYDQLQQRAERVRELEQLQEMHSDAWNRAIKLWQDETGRTDTWPDGAKHYAYLMGKITELERECQIHCDAMTMLQENHDADIAKLEGENERVREQNLEYRLTIGNAIIDVQKDFPDHYIADYLKDKLQEIKALNAGGEDENVER